VSRRVIVPSQSSIQWIGRLGSIGGLAAIVFFSLRDMFGAIRGTVVAGLLQLLARKNILCIQAGDVCCNSSM
jgi:hypothetical protein